MTRDKRAAFARVQQDDGFLRPDLVGEPILQAILANRITRERIRAALVVLRNEVEASVLGDAVSGCEENERVALMNFSRELCDCAFDAIAGRRLVAQERDLHVGVLRPGRPLQLLGNCAGIVDRQAQRFEQEHVAGPGGVQPLSTYILIPIARM